MYSWKIKLIAVFTGSMLCTTAAQATIVWTGFATAAGAISSVDYVRSGQEPLYLNHIGRQLSLDKDSVLGLQLDTKVEEIFTLTGRLVASGDRDWSVHATRLVFSYNPSDKWFWSIGRLPVDYLILSEAIHQSHQHPWIALPEPLYDMIPFHYLDGTSLGFKAEIWHRHLIMRGTYGALSEHIRTPVSDQQIRYKIRNWLQLMGVYGNNLFRVQASYGAGLVSMGGLPAHDGINNFINTQIANSQLGGDYLNYVTAYNHRLQYQSIGYIFNWKHMVSMAEFFRRRSAAPIIPSLNAWYIMAGVEFFDVFPYIQFTRQRITDNDRRRFPGAVNMAALAPAPMGLGHTLDKTVQNIAEGMDGPAAGDQSSITIGVRWNVLDAVSVKASYQHIHPDRLGSGLFNIHPHKSVNIYRLGLDALFASTIDGVKPSDK